MMIGSHFQPWHLQQKSISSLSLMTTYVTNAYLKLIRNSAMTDAEYTLSTPSERRTN
jgi:hypothetical protein